MNKNQLRPGDLVRVKSFGEIQKTLDSQGTLDSLVFMPEMATLCGKTFHVFRRATHVVTDGAPVGNESRVRAFYNEDVVLLDNVRCSGLAHGDCKRGCMIFWKEAWLEKITTQTQAASATLTPDASTLQTLKEPGFFYCQSSEILKASRHMSGKERILTPLKAIKAGNYSIPTMIRHVAVWLFWRTRRKFFGEWPAGKQTDTPAETLNLQPGEWVEVKPLAEIVQTLDKHAKNRGLHFSADMPPFCGKRFRVATRADKLIAEGTGKVRSLKNTVTLEGSVCDSAIYSIGACPREDLLYWREIWLKRVDGPDAIAAAKDSNSDHKQSAAVV